MKVNALVFAALSLLLATIIVRYFNEMPPNTDAFYHYNAATRIAAGEGFVDDVLWTYVGAPDTLPAPSHLYWMPLTSVIAALGMMLFGESYAAAQLGLIACLWGAALLTYWLGYRMGGTWRHAWVAGLIVLTGGFFMRFWGATDTFAPYVLLGSLALTCMGLGASQDDSKAVQRTGQAIFLQRDAVLWVLAGVFTALGHLTRSDGLLLLVIGWLVILWPFGLRGRLRRAGVQFVLFTVAYGLVMLPWFLRNLDAIGALLPTGGTQAIWYTSYLDLFSYPPDANPTTFFADGLGLLFASRWEALTQALGTFVAIEGIIVMTPLMLLGLWNRRADAFWRPVWLFAPGIHAAFVLLFPYPGIRGGLFHAVAALLPFWATLALLGLDDLIAWRAKRRRSWRPGIARPLFSLFMLGTIILISLQISLPRRQLTGLPPLYPALERVLPADARVMINDPGILYYYTDRGGVTLPNETPDVIPVIARTYGIDYLLIEFTRFGAAMPPPLIFDFDNPPDFLTPIPELNRRDARLYAIQR